MARPKANIFVFSHCLPVPLDQNFHTTTDTNTKRKDPMQISFMHWKSIRNTDARTYETGQLTFEQIAQRFFENPIQTSEPYREFSDQMKLFQTARANVQDLMNLSKQRELDEQEKARLRLYTSQSSEAKKYLEQKKESAGCFFAGIYDQHRSKDTTICRTMLSLDLEKGMDSKAFKILKFRLDQTGRDYLIHTTRKHTPNAPRFRVYVPLDHPIHDESLFQAVSKAFCQTFQIPEEWTDQSCHEFSRCMYLPSISGDGKAEYLYHAQTGRGPFSISALNLDLSAIEADRLERRQNQTARQGFTEAKTNPAKDPRQSGGIDEIRWFCSVYPVTEVLDSFLNHVYSRSTRRPSGSVMAYYDFLPGSAPSGLAIYTGNLWAISHDATDPVNDGKAKNAYDLARIHGFSGDHKALNQWIYAQTGWIEAERNGHVLNTPEKTRRRQEKKNREQRKQEQLERQVNQFMRQSQTGFLDPSLLWRINADTCEVVSCEPNPNWKPPQPDPLPEQKRPQTDSANQAYSPYRTETNGNTITQTLPDGTTFTTPAQMPVTDSIAIVAADDEMAYISRTVNERTDDFLKNVEDGSYIPIPTGFEFLDIALDGGIFAKVYYIGAVSSLGKTTFCLQMADQIAEAGFDVLFISLEMSDDELRAKSISRTSAQILSEENQGTADPVHNALTTNDILKGGNHIRNQHKDAQGNLIDGRISWDLYQRAHARYCEKSGNNLRIVLDDSSLTAQKIERLIRYHIARYQKVPVVFIDYLQVLTPPPGMERSGDKQIVDYHVHELKKISRKYKVPIIGISSVNRTSYLEPMTTTSFKESGNIEFGADVLIGLEYEGMEYEYFDREDDNGNPVQVRESKESHNGRVSVLIDHYKTEAKKGNGQPITVKILKDRSNSLDMIPMYLYPRYNLITPKPISKINFRNGRIAEGNDIGKTFRMKKRSSKKNQQSTQETTKPPMGGYDPDLFPDDDRK